MRIINFGSLNIDFVYKVDSFVKPGETISSISMEKFAGGKGLNQSIAISRAGGNVVHAGFFGSEGVFLRDMLKGSGVDISLLTVANVTNGHAIIQVDNRGENSIVLFAGTNGMIDEKYIDEVLKNATSEELVIFQNETSSIDYAMQKCKQKGCKIAFNPAPMNKKVLSYPLELVDIFIVNFTEGQLLSGENESQEILDALAKKFPDAKIILTLGSDGSWFSHRDERFHINAFKVKNVVDTTAAGDTFIGYYLSNMNRMGDKGALEIASKAASVSIGRMGAAVSIPKIADLV